MSLESTWLSERETKNFVIIWDDRLLAFIHKVVFSVVFEFDLTTPAKNLKDKSKFNGKTCFLNFQNGRASSESSEDGAGSSASTSRGAGSYGSGCAGGWRSVFGAVSGRELRLYECAPWSPEAWASPSITCPLIATRWEFTSFMSIFSRLSLKQYQFQDP